MWLGPPSSQTMMTAFEEARRAGAPCASRRNRSARVRPPTQRPPTLRKLRREIPSQVLPLCSWEVTVSTGSLLVRKESEPRGEKRLGRISRVSSPHRGGLSRKLGGDYSFSRARVTFLYW